MLRPLSVVFSVVLIFLAFSQTLAFSWQPDLYQRDPRFGRDGVSADKQRLASGFQSDLTIDSEALESFRDTLPENFDPVELLASSELNKTKRPKLDSQLNQLVDQLGARPMAAIASQAAVSKESSVAVTIRISGDVADIVPALESHAAVIANTSDGVIEAYVPVSELAAVSDLEAVEKVESIIPPQPDSTSQGTGIHGSPGWNTNGYTGAGVKVGVIDGGFQGLTQFSGSELPRTVVARCYSEMGVFSNNLSACENAVIHGTGVAEAVLDIAPAVDLYIANPVSPLDTRETASWMASQGVSVINYSIGWLWDGPGDGTSPFSDSPLRTVDEAIGSGVTWVNSAGNYGESTWFGPFIDNDLDGFTEFANGDEGNSVYLYQGQRIMIQARWSDRWGGATTNVDLFLVNNNSQLVSSSIAIQAGSPQHVPTEMIWVLSHLTVGIMLG